ncbi:myoD family inhibitor-like [Protopterus annectens]|uniref:myoD family inhibitor-like n=1 Tax=Protopterus annectens TaxID=7888 RepID=UPI001CFA8D82|nr:myoD family inhibitor-like [Protopterus annectens]
MSDPIVSTADTMETTPTAAASGPDMEKCHEIVQEGRFTQDDLHSSGRLSDGERSLAGEEYVTSENASLISSKDTETTQTGIDSPLMQPLAKPVSSTLPKSNTRPVPYSNGVPLLTGNVSGTTSSEGPICSPPMSRTVIPMNGRIIQEKKKRLDSSSSSVCTKSSKKSHSSCKSTASQIQEAAGDDCCVHCILACLFCEFLTLCTLVTDCLACRGCVDACSCCCCGSEDCNSEERCPCSLDCGMLEDCCGSSDCLEICLECCSICFPA